MKAAIIGATGYGGAELIRLIQHHPYLELGTLVSTSQTGPVARVYPHLSHIDRSFEGLHVDELCANNDLIFLATPPGVSSEWTPLLAERGKIVIDLSGDFRLDRPEVYQAWYGKQPAPANWLRRAVYGLSEWFGEEVKEAQIISNPGCYPTATLLALLPLLQAKAIDPSTIIIDAKSGVSGAGRGLKQAMLFGEVNENLRPYKVDGHQHIPEIERFASFVAGQEIRVNFVPHLVPMNRGILVTIYAKRMNNYSIDDLSEIYQNHYQKASFIRLRQQEWPETKQVQGSNYCDIAWHIDERTHQVIVLSAIDNLMKGAAGQAIQNANLRLGWPEESGLTFSPLFP
ncbi:N-acetyl-gamma-glutamyl-phosphate reductase [Thermoflavimicrobium dichotomicum]|uniref:N-acetyl-gamma-glutamyl-phosphate reductase n=1 Tax=Thermoflavimicrobium dichotomicum TaxID=46223 RepID=A0A1I3NYA5_9BACL|nr:N-acetyl-gamma-glutamyl-phosphate reductase [Thermoflavimicrobium dichotomicum]SFJ14010.1 N-acetyl-gamma-glutamyl-phosphate reductase [Thermoflavimicrobium dichotomicum]